MPTLTPHDNPRLQARPEDLPLHEDVRWLAAALGRVIQRLEGQESFEIVEQLRVATRARRHGQRDAPSLEDLLRRIEGLSVEQCAMAARAFTLFFLLINTAEQTHRVRRRNTYLGKGMSVLQPASVRWSMRRLREMGRGLGKGLREFKESVSGDHTPGHSLGVPTLDVPEELTTAPTLPEPELATPVVVVTEKAA